MSLETKLIALSQAIGGDIKNLSDESQNNYYRYFNHCESTSGLSIVVGTGGSVTALAYTQNASYANHPGVVQLASGTTSATSGAAFNSVSPTTLSSNEIIFETLLKIPTLSSDFEFQCGMFKYNSTWINPGFGFRYDTTYSNNWHGIYTDASNVPVKTNLNTLVVADTWYLLEVIIHPLTFVVSFYINNVLVGTYTAPSALSVVLPIYPNFNLVKLSGLVDRTVWVDKYYLKKSIDIYSNI